MCEEVVIAWFGPFEEEKDRRFREKFSQDTHHHVYLSTCPPAKVGTISLTSTSALLNMRLKSWFNSTSKIVLIIAHVSRQVKTRKNKIQPEDVFELLCRLILKSEDNIPAKMTTLSLLYAFTHPVNDGFTRSRYRLRPLPFINLKEVRICSSVRY